MARRFIRPRLSDQQGNVLSGGWLRVLAAGTDTEVDVFAAAVGGTALAQPLSTDARGEVECWLIDSVDVDLEWSDSGATYRGGTSRRAAFSTFTEFVEAPPAGGGGGSTLHADLTDLATSGHPAAAISGLGGAALLDVGAVAGTVAAGDDGRFTPSGLHADLTDLATSGHPASAISGLGGAATLNVGTGAGTVAAGDDSRITGAVPKSTVTTAGDLIYGTGNAAVSRLGIGSALQVLRTNAGATAPEWATVSSGAMSVIARTVVGTPASSVDFSSIPATYENLMVTFLARGSATGSEAIPIYARLNNDSGSNYGWHWSYATGNSGGAVTGPGNYAVTTMQVGYIADSSAETSHPGAGTLTIPGYARTVFVKAVQATWSFLPFYQYSNNKGRSGFASATWNNTAAVNQITLYPSAGNFVTGSVFTLYGIAGA